MKNQLSRGDRGFVKLIILIVIGLLVISYFGINLRGLVSSPTTQDNISYVASSTVMVWNGYLKVPATYIWNFFVDLIWTPAIDNLKKMKAGEPTNINQQTPASTLPNLPVYVQ